MSSRPRTVRRASSEAERSLKKARTAVASIQHPKLRAGVQEILNGKNEEDRSHALFDLNSKLTFPTSPPWNPEKDHFSTIHESLIVNDTAKFAPAMLHIAQHDPSTKVRRWGIVLLDSILGHHGKQERLGNPLLGKSQVSRIRSFLNGALFDNDREIRERSSRAIASYWGWFEVARAINDRHPGASLSKMPAEFFFYRRDGAEKQGEPSFENAVADLRRQRDPTVRQAVDGRRNTSEHDVFGTLRKRYGKPAFFHRGLPVFLASIPTGAPFGSSEALAAYHYGALLVNRDEQLVPPKLRRAEAEHEFGEAFGHDVGNVLSLLSLKRRGLLRDYIELHGHHKHYEFKRLIEEDPKAEKLKKRFHELF